MTATAVRPFWEVNGKRADLWLHEGQARAWNSTRRFVVVLAGTQGGKTVFGPHWLHREIETRGPGDYLAVTATFPLLENKMLPELRKVFEHHLKLAVYHDSRKVFDSIEKINGAPAWRIILGSATNPESLESATANAAWCDEAGQVQFRRDAWEAVRRRLSIGQGRALITTTPYVIGWLKSELVDRALRGDPGIELIQFDSTMNPVFPKEEFEKRRAEMPAWKFNMFYRGRFDRPAGLIYDSFDESVCKIKRFPIADSWPGYVGHDFGAVNTAAMFYRVDPTTGYIYAWAEYHPRSARSTYEHVLEFKRITQGVNILRRVGGSHQEQEIRDGYAAHGWPILEPKILNVEPRIDRVYALHKLNKIFVFDDMVGYLDEKQSYSRKLDDNYKPTEEIADKAEYHLMDAEAYLLADFTPETARAQRARTKASTFAF